MQTPARPLPIKVPAATIVRRHEKIAVLLIAGSDRVGPFPY
jgi:hypothetical protein